MSHRILFIASHRPGRSPSQRFRFEQYLGHLAEAGFDSEMSWIVSPEDDRRIYRPGHLASKAAFALRSQVKRARDVRRAGAFDVVFVHREILMNRGLRFERGLARSSAKVVYDFDDAIWMPTTSQANRAFRWMKDPDAVRRTIGVANLVIAGNDYLAEYAGRFAESVRVIPTTIDTDLFHPGGTRKPESAPIRIGWSGSHTTVPHFEQAVDALVEVKRRFGDRVEFSLIGDGGYRNDALSLTGTRWSLETEIEEVRKIDIGIMPLPDDEWSKGKCGFKALLYMSFGIPAVVSPVGVNTEIVEDGVNGLIADDATAWVDALSRLVEDAELRRRLGAAGRETVVNHYSVRRRAADYVDALRSLVEPSAKSAR